MKIAILGYGREGQSVLKYLFKHPEYRGAKITVLDKNPLPKLPAGISKQTGKNYLKGLRAFDLIFRSPGIPYTLPALARARKIGVTISSLTKLFFDEAPKITKNIIGITGTKGKGTTSTLLARMLAAGGKRVHLAGNIGAPALDMLPKLKKSDWVVLELSSFQLQDLEVSPHIAVILDMFPDHLDAHATLAEYYGAKANIARHQTKNDTVFYAAENKESLRAAKTSPGKKIAVSPKKFPLFSQKNLHIPGEHNFKNSVMAAAVAKTVGVPQRTIAETAKAFRGTEHRLELVKRTKSIALWNDSASTNPNTAAAALRAFAGEKNILIAGGQDKNLDYAPLAETLTSKECRNGSTLVVLYGENKYKIKKALRKACAIIEITDDLRAALKFALHTAHLTRDHVNIIFSPGATSFDMFKNYAHRGEEFKKLVKNLTK